MSQEPSTEMIDMKLDGWVARVPLCLQPYIYIMRLDRFIGVWLLLLPGLWAIICAYGGAVHVPLEGWWLATLFCIGAVVMRGAGCVINDIWDRDLDAQVSRTKARPLASGTLSVRRALAFLGLLLLIGLGILWQMNSFTIVLGFMVMPLIVAYPLMKRVTYWPQAFLGLTFNFSALMGWAAVTGGLDVLALLLYAGGLFWTLGYDTIYAHQDKDDDALIGVRSTALLFGGASVYWVSGFYLVALLCFSVVLALSSSVAILLLGALAMGAHLFWQVFYWQKDETAHALRVFRSNRDFGLVVLFFMCAV